MSTGSRASRRATRFSVPPPSEPQLQPPPARPHPEVVSATLTCMRCGEERDEHHQQQQRRWASDDGGAPHARAAQGATGGQRRGCTSAAPISVWSVQWWLGTGAR